MTDRSGMSYSRIRHRHGVGDRGEVRHQPRLRGPRVVRGHDQKSVCPFGFACLRQVHAVRGVVGSRACDDACAIADGVQHRAQQRDLLVVGGRRRFTGGAGQHQAVAPGSRRDGWPAWRRPSVSSEPSDLNGVTIAVSTVPSRALHVESAGAHGHQDYPLDLQASVANGDVATSVPSASVAISKSANACGATSMSWRRHSIASRRISTSACSLARIAMKCRHAR